MSKPHLVTTFVPLNQIIWNLYTKSGTIYRADQVRFQTLLQLSYRSYALWFAKQYKFVGFHSITYIPLFKQIIWNLYTGSGTLKSRQSLIFDLTTFSVPVICPLICWREILMFLLITYVLLMRTIWILFTIIFYHNTQVK